MIKRYTLKDPIFKNNSRYKFLCTEINDSPVLNIFRLISGTVNINDIFFGNIYKIRNNNIKFPKEKNLSLKYTVVRDLFDESIVLKELDLFFKLARLNKKFYKSLETELIKCLIAYETGRYLESFFYLYRIIEGISYSIPLIYISKKDDYNKTFKDLKTFFGNDKDGELKFFKKFVSETFKNEDFFKSNIVIDLNVIEIEELRSVYYKYYYEKLEQNSIVDESENNYIKVNFIGYFDLLINLRNRFFHNLKGTSQNNFESTELIFPDQFFKPITLHGINWISIILFEIIKFDLQKIK